MKLPLLSILILANLVAIRCLVIPEPRQASAFPSASGTKFSIDGQTGYFAGSNSYWISFLTNDADVDLVMDNVWYQHLSPTASRINTGANGLQRLDAVVFVAAAAERKAFGGSKESWYTNAQAQSQYQAFIRAVVGWYKDSAAIFAWELANEPRFKGCHNDVIFKWAESSSKFVKSLDANHMYSEGTDFVKNLGIETLDFGTFHMYPDH
ncbi:Mannan endo-1,4-beta-mannosidase A, partial [Colletotrichum shisoi]